jgi:hypothetical protein
VATLVDVRTDRHLWVETYDRQVTDIFSIQTDVALHIAAALEAKLSPDEQHPSAKGSDRRTSRPIGFSCRAGAGSLGIRAEGYARAIEYFEQALARDPASRWPGRAWP